MQWLFSWKMSGWWRLKRFWRIYLSLTTGKPHTSVSHSVRHRLWFNTHLPLELWNIWCIIWSRCPLMHLRPTCIPETWPSSGLQTSSGACVCVLFLIRGVCYYDNACVIVCRSKDIESTGFNGTAAFMEVRVQSIVVEFILTHVPDLFSSPGTLFFFILFIFNITLNREEVEPVISCPLFV